MIYFITGVKRVCMVLILSSTFFRNSKQVRAFSLKKEAKIFFSGYFRKKRVFMLSDQWKFKIIEDFEGWKLS